MERRRRSAISRCATSLFAGIVDARARPCCGPFSPIAPAVPPARSSNVAAGVPPTDARLFPLAAASSLSLRGAGASPRSLPRSRSRSRSRVRRGAAATDCARVRAVGCSRIRCCCCCCDGGALAPLSALLTLSPRLLLRDRTRSPPASLQASGERSLSAVPADSAVASLSSFDSSFSAASAARFSADCDESSGRGESRSGSSFIVSSSIGDGSSASVGMGASPLETSSMWRAAAATCAVVGRLLS